MDDTAMNRLDEISAGLDRTRERVADACAAAGRDPAELTIIVVTKTYPVTDVKTLADLGVRDVGENRDQEAAPKAAACVGVGVHWHFVGQLQTNKASSVARYASAVHSVDRARLVHALDKGATAAGRRLGTLVQVSLDDTPGRGGASPGDVAALADLIAESASLTPAGVMAVAPLGAEPGRAFAKLGAIAERVQRDHPSATWISAGMSADLEAAVAHGATHLRIGSAILGERAYEG